MNMTRRKFIAAGSAAASLAFPPAEERGGDPIDSLTDLVKEIPAPPLSEFESRLERARELMAEHRLDAFFVEGGSSLEYFTGVSWGRSERMFAAVIPRKGEMGFVCPAFEQGRAMERIRFPEADVRAWQEHEDPYQTAARLLNDRKVRTGRLALEPTTRFFLASAMEKASPGLEFVNGVAISDGCRMTKSVLELDYMRLANKITKTAYRAALAGLEEGMTEPQLAQRISQAHTKMGVRGGALTLFGPASAYPHGTRERRRLQEGDVVLVDGGCKVHGYSSDVTRTAVFGKPSQKLRDIWEIVRRAQDAALQAARPGIPCQQLDRVARGVIEKAGYGPGYKYFTHRLGHGIGLDGHEAPYLVEGNSLKMQPGMTFSDEPGIYILGEFGVRHEDIVVVTEDGAEIMGEKVKSIEKPV